MTSIYASLKYDSPELIIAERRDDTRFTIEPTDGMLWTEAVSGAFGPVEPYVAPPEPDPLDVWRSTRSMTRQHFCIALFQQNVLSHDDAMTAAKGDWPPAFAGALDTVDDPELVQLVWAGAQDIGRKHPLIAMLQAFSIASETVPELTDEFVDQLFGWVTDG